LEHASKRKWTVDEVLLLNEALNVRLEVIDGQLLVPDTAPPEWEEALERMLQLLSGRRGGDPD
jgi:hypothetical protein